MAVYRISSDWHLNHWKNYLGYDSPFEFLEETTDDKNQILLLAGDIADGNTNLENYRESLEEVFARFKKVLYVPGNHDFYFRKIKEKQEEDTEFFQSLGVEYLVNKKHEDIFGTTLWTSFDLQDMDKKLAMDWAQGAMSDFRVIKFDDYSTFTPADSILLHEHALKKIDKTDASVIITHHAPSKKSIHSDYFGSLLNPAFASDLDELILRKEPKLWVHGHVHNSFNYFLGKTRVVCNPVGYPGENFQTSYNKNLTIEV